MSWLDFIESHDELSDFELGRSDYCDYLKKELENVYSIEALIGLKENEDQSTRLELQSALRMIINSLRCKEVSSLLQIEEDLLACSEAEQEKLIAGVIDNLFGFGPIEHLLQDDAVSEIMLNGCKSLFYEKSGRLFEIDNPYKDENEIRPLIDKIIAPLSKRVDELNPYVNARLPSGYRVHIIIPPLALDGSTVTIRKFREQILSFSELVENGSLDVSAAKFLSWAVELKKSMLVIGGTGSGKTTFLNALSTCIPSGERIITIEDSAELKFQNHPHVVRLEAREKNSEGKGEVSIQDLVINSLRMRPDRIIVGECRGKEAFDMLQALNTGHEGSLTTLHANSTRDALSRLTSLVRYAQDLNTNLIEEQIAQAFDLIIKVTRLVSGKRIVEEIAEISFESNKKQAIIKPIYQEDIYTHKRRWLTLPTWIEQITEAKIADKREVEEWSMYCLQRA